MHTARLTSPSQLKPETQVQHHPPRMQAATKTCCRALMAALPLILAVGCASPPASQAPPVPTVAAAKTLKREGPTAVAPVRFEAMQISVLHWGLERGLPQNGGYIVASDAITGRELWLLKVYEVRYDPKRERDVQDTFIVEMKADASGSLLLIRDELGRVHTVDPRARTVRIR